MNTKKVYPSDSNLNYTTIYLSRLQEHEDENEQETDAY